MKKFINMIIMTVVFAIAVMFNTAAQAMDVQQYILNTMPGISQQEAAWCADAHRNGGEFLIKHFDITLKCSKNTIIKDWDRPSN